MNIPTPTELGQIIVRLTMADEVFIQLAIGAALSVKGKMRPGDVENLMTWGWYLKTLRETTGIYELSGASDPKKKKH